MKKLLVALAVAAAAGLYYVQSRHLLYHLLAYVKQNPGSLGGMTPKVEYGMGTLYYVKGNYPCALGAFNQLLTDYPTHYYAPKALFRVGSMHQEMQNWGEAKAAYQKLLEEFPDDPSRSLTEKKLEFIKYK